MGAVAASMSGFGKMRSDIDELKKAIAMIEGITSKLQDGGKQLTDKADEAMKFKTDLESKLGGITGQLDSVKKVTDGLGGQLGSV
jgi:uncharacterized phage infection (PIP) family protein YhgE